LKPTTETTTIEFHHSYGHPVRRDPQTVSREEALLVLRLIEEEYLELVEAFFPERIADDAYLHVAELDGYDYDPDLEKIADAVGDLDVVTNGAGIRHGLDMRLLNQAIHKSNMSKLGADGRPLYYESGPKKGKIRKGPNFVEPDLRAVLAR
jgi:predicted HAD superfamily Cof-like phosphohydrolase